MTNTQPIGAAQIRALNEILQRYKAGKSNCERRIIENEQWWKLANPAPRGRSTVESNSAWLANVIMNKHADAMDAYPCCTCLPHEPSDEAEAEKLSSILPAILRENDFEKVYSDVWWHKLKFGAGCYKVIWDGRKLGGLGDISICRVNLLNLFWEPGVEDIQDSEYVFHVELQNAERLRAQYPQLDKIEPGALTVRKFLYDDAVDLTGKCLVVDCYYRRGAALHYCKYVGEQVLYATENEGMTDGLYRHGRYPFVLDVMFPVEGSVCGYGYIDFGKTTQSYIDRLTGAVMENALAAATPRWFVRSDGGINEDEYADFSNHFIHCGGTLGDDSVRQIRPYPLSGVYLSLLEARIDELKQTLGNRDTAAGGVSASVTSASGIASLQEAAGKLSRDAEKASYRVFAQVIYLCIELIRQFYDVTRSFRITGELGRQQFVRYDNAGLRPQALGGFGAREVRFDIDVQPQKENPYTRESYNELAMQLYSMGALTPPAAETTLLMLEMMDFKGKAKLQRRLTELAQAYRQAAADAGQDADDAGGKSDTGGRSGKAGKLRFVVASSASSASPQAAKLTRSAAPPLPTRTAALGSRGAPEIAAPQTKKEHPFARRAREQAAKSTQPR